MQGLPVHLFLHTGNSRHPCCAFTRNSAFLQPITESSPGCAEACWQHTACGYRVGYALIVHSSAAALQRRNACTGSITDFIAIEIITAHFFQMFHILINHFPLASPLVVPLISPLHSLPSHLTLYTSGSTQSLLLSLWCVSLVRRSWGAGEWRVQAVLRFAAAVFGEDFLG